MGIDRLEGLREDGEEILRKRLHFILGMYTASIH